MLSQYPPHKQSACMLFNCRSDLPVCGPKAWCAGDPGCSLTCAPGPSCYRYDPGPMYAVSIQCKSYVLNLGHPARDGHLSFSSV